MKKLIALTIVILAASCSTPKAAVDPTPAEASAPAAEPESAPETAAADVLPNDGTRQIGDVTTCAVTGDVFTVSETSPVVEHEGGTYYFCCKGCVKEFTADPAKFLAAKTAPAEGAPATDTAPAAHDHGSHKHAH